MSNSKTNRSKSKSRSSEQERRLLQLTRDLVKIEQGKKNPNSKVYEAHQNAVKPKEQKAKKTLY